MMYKIRPEVQERINIHPDIAPAFYDCWQNYLDRLCHWPSFRMTFGDTNTVDASYALAQLDTMRFHPGPLMETDIEDYRRPDMPMRTITDEQGTLMPAFQNMMKQDGGEMLNNAMEYTKSTLINDLGAAGGACPLDEQQIVWAAHNMAVGLMWRDLSIDRKNDTLGAADTFSRNIDRRQRLLYSKKQWQKILALAIPEYRKYMSATAFKDKWMQKFDDGKFEADIEALYFKWAQHETLKIADMDVLGKYGNFYVAPKQVLMDGHRWMLKVPGFAERHGFDEHGMALKPRKQLSGNFGPPETDKE